MLKRVFYILLGFVCMLSCVSAEESGFEEYAYGRGFYWEVSLEDVLHLLGEDAEHAEDSDPAIGTMNVVRAQVDMAYGIENVLITAMFFDDALAGITYLFPHEGIADVQALVDMVSLELGEADMYGEKVSMTDLMSGTKTICDWEQTDKVEADLIREKKDAGDYILIISNIEVMNKLEERLMEAAA